MIRIRGQICCQPITNGEAHSQRVFFDNALSHRRFYTFRDFWPGPCGEPVISEGGVEVLASPFASLAPSSAAVPWVAARVSVPVVQASAFHSDSVYSLSVEELGASLFRW